MTDSFSEYASYEDDVDLDPTNKPPSNQIDRFKGETKKVYRVALLYFHPLGAMVLRAMAKKAKKEGKEVDKEEAKKMIEKALSKRAESLDKPVDKLEEWEKLDMNSAQFRKYVAQFHKDAGVVVSRLGKDGPEADKVWNMLDEPRIYYSTIILIYPTDRHGNVDVKNVLRDGEVKLWRFSNGVFRTLIEKNKMLAEYGQSLANSDLKLSCKSAQYQNFDIDPAGSAIWVKSDSIKQKFLPQAYALYEKMIDARKLTTSQLREKLELVDVEEGGSDVTDDVDIEGMLQDV